MPASRILDEILWIPLRLYHNIPVNRVPWGYGWLSHFERVPLLWSSGEVWLAASLMGKGIGLVVAFLAFPVAGVLVIFRIVRFRRLSMEERWRWQVALSMTGALILMALHKPVSLILLFALPGPLLLILWEWERFRVFRPRLADWLVGMCLALPLTLTAVVSSLPQPYLAPRSSFEFNAGVLTTEENPGKPLWDLLHRFQTSAYRPGQSVFCYRYCSFYSFVLGIPGATGYDNFDVGCLDPAMVNDLLTQLAAKPPNWILLDGTYGRDDPVVAWIKARYHPLEMCRGLFIVGRADTAAKPPVPPELP